MNPSQRGGWKRTSVANRRMVWLTAIVAFATLCLAVASLFQYLTARQQSKAAIEQAGTAKEQANVMQRQLNTMQDQANSMKAQTKTLDQSLAETRKSVNAAEKQADASKASVDVAQRGVTITQETFRLIERPSLGVDNGAELTKFEAAAEIEGRIPFKNSGHTPARYTSVRAKFVFQPAGDISAACPEPPESGIVGLASRTPIPIGGIKWAHPHSIIKANDVDIKRIESGEWWLFVYAIVRYEGVSGQKYFTEYYARYNPQRKDFEECGTHNDAN